MSKIIVVKIGESSLVDSQARIDRKKVERMSMILSNLQNSGKQVVLISAGAIALAAELLDTDRHPEELGKQQAMAAIGQIELIKLYQRCFDVYGQNIAQVLLTRNVIKSKDRSKNAVSTLHSLLEMGSIPIINENDTISTDDIELEDNYPLASNVANMLTANLLVITSDLSGKFVLLSKSSTTPYLIQSEQELFEKVDQFFEPDNNDGLPFPAQLSELNL